MIEVNSMDQINEICSRTTCANARKETVKYTCVDCGAEATVSLRQFKERGKKELTCQKCDTKKKNILKYGVDNVFKTPDFNKKYKKPVEKKEEEKTPIVYVPITDKLEYDRTKINPPEFVDTINLPSSYEEWTERVEYLKDIVRNIFIENKISFEENVELEKGFKLDFYSKEHNLGVEIYDLLSHHCGVSLVEGVETVSKTYSYERWKKARELGLRLICVYENEILNERKYKVIKNMIQYQCGIYNRFYARNTYVDIVDAIKMKDFYERNNVQGYRSAKKAFVLKDKKTNEPLMMYSIGHAFFGNGLYSAELARGACDIDYHGSGKGIQVIGGASKLWKNIMEYYENHDIEGEEGKIDSITYYVDLRYYSGVSIGHLMDGEMVNDLGDVKQLTTTPSFTNYWRNVESNPADRRGVMKNREPLRNKEITEGYRNGNILFVPNAGTATNVFIRKGTKLRENTIENDKTNK